MLFLLFLILVTNSCNWFNPERRRVAERHKLAARFQRVMADAGGVQIWVRTARLRHGQSSDVPLHVLATPAAYSAVLTAVEVESDKENLDLRVSPAKAAAGLQAVNLHILQDGQRIMQIHLQEVHRLLRAVIVIDDMGHDLKAAHELLALDYPLTFSILPDLPYTRVTAEEVHRGGREVMLHLPMQPEPDAHVSPGKGAIFVGMNAAEVRQVVENDLDSIPYVAGVNNHMGSLATQNPALMAEVMEALSGRRLYFIDSRTTPASTALKAARRRGLPAFYRTVFLDDKENVPYTLGQLQIFRQVVEREGVALAIGHPHPTTIAALAKFLPELVRADIELVAPSQIVRLPEIARLRPPASQN